MTHVRVGVLGTGGMGTRHVVNLQRHVVGAQVAAVYDLDRDRAQQAAAYADAAVVYDDPLRLIQSEHVDALIVASPDATHVALVLECLRCGKPVLCEKPLATSVADTQRIVEVEAVLGRRLVAVGFMRRFDPQHRAVQSAIASGQLGRAIVYKGVHRNATMPYELSGAGVLANSASHDVDAARWLLGQEVREIFVRGVRTRASFSRETQDLLLLQLVLSSDCLAAVEVFVAAEYGYEVSAEIVAERGTAMTAPPHAATVRFHGARSVAVPGEWLERFEAAYVAELQQWVQSIQTQQPFGGANAWDGYMALLVTDAGIQSLHSGEPVAVPSPPIPALYR